jgi:hypothetical protein
MDELATAELVQQIFYSDINIPETQTGQEELNENSDTEDDESEEEEANEE